MPNSPEVMSKALRKVTSAAGGLGFKAVLVGAAAHQAWGATREAAGLELLISSGPAERESLLSAARGEGLQQSPDKPLGLRYTDAKLGLTVTVDITEASTPFHAQVIARAQRTEVLSLKVLVATC